MHRIAGHLKMEALSYVQSIVSRHRKLNGCHNWKVLQKNEKLD